MKREDIEKLIGGYAAGILTDEERRELFAAALDDQALFDELMREQPLRELFEDPSSRREIRQAVAAKPAPRRWLWAIPATVALATAAFLVMLVRVPSPEPVQVAQTRIDRAPYAASPPPFAPADGALEERKPRPRMSAPVNSRKEAAQILPPPPTVAFAPSEKLEIPEAAKSQAFSADQAAPQRETARAKAAGEMREAAAPPPASPQAAASPAPPPSGPMALAVRTAPSARAMFYGISGRGVGLLRRTAEVPEPQLGVRYTRDGSALTVETNVAAHVRILDGENVLFDRDVAARVRTSIAAPEGKLRMTVRRAASPLSEASNVIEERAAEERATYAVAERGATSMTVTLP